MERDMNKMEKISVIVSCYNEEKALPLFYKEMERVRKQDFKEIDFEYIFVNDGSEDKTLEDNGLVPNN